MIADKGGPGLPAGVQAGQPFQMLLDRELADLNTQLQVSKGVCVQGVARGNLNDVE